MADEAQNCEGGTMLASSDEPAAPPAVDMLSRLSHDLAEKVLMHVGEGPALAAASQVCHRWHELATSNSVWSHQYHLQYPHSIISSSIISISTATSVQLPSPTHAPAHSPEPADAGPSTSRSAYLSAPETGPRASVSPRNGLYSHRKGGESSRLGDHNQSSPAAAAAAKGPQHAGSRAGQAPELGPRTLVSPDGHASWREAYVWKLRLDAAWRRRKPWPLAALQEHRAWLSCVRLLPASQRLVSGGLDDQLCIWHTDGSLEHALRLDSSCTCLDVWGQHVVSGGVAGEINLWDLNTGAPRGRWAVTGTGRATSMQLLGDQQLLAAHGKSPVRLWDLRALSTTTSTNTIGGDGPELSATAPAATGPGTSAAGPQPAMHFTVNTQGPPRAPGMRPSTVELRCAALDPHTQLMVVSDQSGSLHVFDIRMGGARAMTRVQAYDPDQREGGSPDITSMALSRGRLATGSAGGLIKVWDLHALSHAAPGQDYSRYALHDPEDEDNVARYGADTSTGAGGLQSVAAGDKCPLLGVGVGHTSLVLSLAWGEEWQLASASYDGTAAVWDTTGLRVSAGAAPLALQHPMAWMPSLDQPLPLGPDTAPADEPGVAATNAIILRPDFPDGTTAVGRRQMLARSRLPARHRGCAVHAIDIASEPGPSDCVQLVVGGQDATVRLYSVMPEGRRSQLGAKGDREDGGALWASG